MIKKLYKDFFYNYDQFFLLNNINFLPIKADASKRKYFRIKHNEETIILMDSSSDTYSLKKFATISKWLIKNKLSAPKVLYKDFDKGLCLIEDFGKNKFSEYFSIFPQRKYNLYLETINLLQHLSSIEIPGFLKHYSNNEIKKELEIFLVWHVYYKQEKNIKEIKVWDEIWQNLYSFLNIEKDYSIILRDFHIDNLFFLEDRKGFEKIGLIDFQDAIYGHKCYDLVSLLQDVRVFIPRIKEKKLFKFYLENQINISDSFEQAYFIFGTQRLLKIIGIFKRLYYRDKKKDYLQYLKRTEILLKQNLKYPLLNNLSKWINKNA